MLVLLKFAIKRDWIQILAWILGVVGLSVTVAIAYDAMFAADEMAIAELLLMMENPAMIAMVGPVYGNTFGALFANAMLLLTTVAVVVMNIFMVVRHTRADEELGRLELIRSFPVTRNAMLKTLFVYVILVNLSLALVTGVTLGTLGIATMSFGDSLLYGAALGAVGLAFAGITTVLAQLSENTKKVLTFAFIVLAVGYGLRAIGDTGNELLSAVSILGLATRTEVFVNNYWWPVMVALVIAVVFSSLALYLNSIRDLGAGFIAAKPGRATAGKLLNTHFGLALKLNKGLIIGWAIGLFAMGAAYGAAFGDLEGFLEGNEMFAFILEMGGGMGLVEGFTSFLMVIIAILATIPAISLILKIRAEEKRNRLEHLLARNVSRFNILFSYLVLSVITSALMLVMGATGLYVASVGVMDEPILFGALVLAALNYLPALWVLIGLTTLLVGWLPKLTGIAWAYLGFSFFVVYLGAMLSLDEWLINTSVFGHIPQMPIAEFNMATFITIKIIALVLVILGWFGFTERDITG